MGAAYPSSASQPAGSTKPVRRTQHRLGRVPLRRKLIAALLALVVIALAVIGTASVVVLRDYLTVRADNQVRSLHNDWAARLNGAQTIPVGIANTYGPFFAEVRPEGEQIQPYQRTGFSTEPIPAPDVPVSADWVSTHSNQLVTVGGFNSHGDSWRIIASPVSYTSNLGTAQTGTLIVGVDLGDVNGAIGRLTTIDLVVGLIVLAGLAVIGVAIVRASLRPLTDIEQTAQSIAAGDLTRRVPDDDPSTEVGRLGQSLNTMLAQIEYAFGARTRSEEAARWSEERMRRFVADASHELRTPLTAIRGFAEHYRQRGGLHPPSPGQDTASSGAAGPDGLTRGDVDRLMRRVEDQATRMGVLVDDLLLLARLDQQRPLDTGTVDLLAIAADAAQDARVVAPGRAISVTVSTGAALLVTGDEVRLRQVVGNLVSNALTHTPAASPVELRLRAGTLGDGRPAAVLEVADHGPGLTREQASRAFERFYRADPARTSGGTGLGLSIVAALVAAHRGQVWLETPPAGGAVFAIALPLAPEAVDAGASPDDFMPAAEPDAGTGQAAAGADPLPEPPAETSQAARGGALSG